MRLQSMPKLLIVEQNSCPDCVEAFHPAASQYGSLGELYERNEVNGVRGKRFGAEAS
jgi:hypothetical protein